ncbi:uncharacterized protein [Nerophis lumbriciformis]|uniref:uncharacterized protein n=1 Tax=Nerophis lumbriciformis TaxID=546530 RepID=UPI002ADFA659|nr:uncharacterized protein LOC133608226 [Nerophis lumbriciformis]XP_061819411.1 uncharacterized protein LOC133608227 [Nerophis lumbriciformis]
MNVVRWLKRLCFGSKKKKEKVDLLNKPHVPEVRAREPEAEEREEENHVCLPKRRPMNTRRSTDENQNQSAQIKERQTFQPPLVDEDQTSEKSSATEQLEQQLSEDDMVESFQEALAVAQQNAAQSLLTQEYSEPPRESSPDWCEWLAVREEESNARLQKVLDSVQETVLLFSSQLENIQRNVDLTLADLKSQMSSMQWHMAAGIVQRDQRIATLESQSCLPGHQQKVSEVDMNLSHRVAYKYKYASMAKPGPVSRPSVPYYPSPDATIQSHLQAPITAAHPLPTFL